MSPNTIDHRSRFVTRTPLGGRGAWAAAVVVGALAAATGGCKRDGGSAAAGGAPGAMPPPPVVVTQAIAQDVPVYLDEIGKCVARESVMVMPQVAGQVTQLHFEDGADIKKGQPLFTIDPRPFEAALHQAQGTLAKDQAGAGNAETYYKRQNDIFKQGFVSPSDYDTARFANEQAKATVAGDMAAVEQAKLNVEYCTIKSPIDGRASARMVDPGNVVKANETQMLSIQRLDPIYADFTVTEEKLSRVRAEAAGGTLKTLVKLPEETEYHEGSLTFVDNAVQDGSGTIKLRATLPNADRHFWPGQFVNVRLVLKVQKDAVLVPTSVPQMSQQGSFALVVTDGRGPDGKQATLAEMRPVKLGQRQRGGELIVIESGVAAGERVITDGQMLVRPGGPVTVMPPPATMPASTQPASTQPAGDPKAVAAAATTKGGAK